MWYRRNSNPNPALTPSHPPAIREGGGEGMALRGMMETGKQGLGSLKQKHSCEGTASCPAGHFF